MDITEICMECRNFFAPAQKKDNRSYIHTGHFTISGHSVTPLDFIQTGQYFRIIGSAKNDGVYCNTTEGLSALSDEVFDGAIWEMSVPKAFVSLCIDIDAWRKKNEDVESANMSPFSAESFAGYSYQKGTGRAQSTATSVVTWQDQFAKRLNAWRRLNVL